MTDQIPKCSDESTLDLVREILAENTLKESNIPSTLILRSRMRFDYPHPTKLEENIKKYSCEANLIVIKGSQEHEIRVAYESQLDDSENHLVTVLNIISGDLEAIKEALTYQEPLRTNETSKPEPLLTNEEAEQLLKGKDATSSNLSIPLSLSFSDYPASEIYNGPHKPPVIDQELEQEATLEDAHPAVVERYNSLKSTEFSDINFAGEFVRAEWSPGTGIWLCTFYSARSGQELNENICETISNGIDDPFITQKGSRLLVVNGSDDLGSTPTRKYYEYDGVKFNLLKTEPLESSE